MMPLPDATIWEKKAGFIDAEAAGKQWIYFGNYTIQQVTSFLYVQRLAGSLLQSTVISPRIKVAKGRMLCSTYAASSPARYSTLRSMRTIVQG